MLQVYKLVFWYLCIKFISVHNLTHVSFGYGYVSYFHFSSSNVNFTVQLLTFSSTAIPVKCTHSVFNMYQPVHFQMFTAICYKHYFVILYTALMSSKQIFRHTCATFRTSKWFSFKDRAFMTCYLNIFPSPYSVIQFQYIQTHAHEIHLWAMTYIQIPFLRTNCSRLLCCQYTQSGLMYCT